ALSPDRLQETIPRFHDLAGRRAALDEAVRVDAIGHARKVSAELEAVERAADRILSAPELAPGALPSRVVHNDCKLNNLLLDDGSGEALCVVDLDTVMPGTVVFDFGELARTGACPAAEDERELDRVHVDPALFRALASGFVAGARGLLTAAEIRALALAGPLMALENGVRFLTDHLVGDRYFRIARAGHNLDRARAQLRLAERMLETEGEMRAVFSSLAKGAP
ncbi:MAG TPA: phosphotransferase, partial [Myxococcota bacterium]|nr:phosphotransferase [Myxococcota bacterium]